MMINIIITVITIIIIQFKTSAHADHIKGKCFAFNSFN